MCPRQLLTWAVAEPGLLDPALPQHCGSAGIKVQRAALLRTARKIMSGDAFVDDAMWDGK